MRPISIDGRRLGTKSRLSLSLISLLKGKSGFKMAGSFLLSLKKLEGDFGYSFIV